MTSVQNHLLRLNGSSGVVCWLLLASLLACSTTKRTGKTISTVPSKAEEKVKIYDPASGTYILVPRDAVKVDTIKWSEDPSPPMITDKEIKDDHPANKTRYEISLLVPFNSNLYNVLDDQLDPKLNRFLQYYAGMKIAAEEFEDSGYSISIHSYDTKTTTSDLDATLKEMPLKNADVIVGPYEKEIVEKVAEFGLKNEKIVVSPWLPSFSMEKENPFFIQVVPGLGTHAAAIMDYISSEMKGKKVYLVARNNPGEINRLLLFKKNADVKTEDLIIDDASLELQRTDLSTLLDDHGTIFILPFYSRSDETFVNSFMRKLHADKETKEVIVFGLPQWTSFNGLNPNYMESLSVHISSSSYVDPTQPSYQDFRTKFYNEFHALPDQQAFIGYDLLSWLGKKLNEGGPASLIGESSSEYGLASGFDIKPVFKADATKPSEMKVPLYYENSRVRILKYFNQDFTIVK
ncbi:MAG: ABC transporter substrate-binding protein [Saprospiraceae bacterium]